MTINKNNFFSVPNILTYLRFLMVGVMIWFFTNNQPLFAMYIYMAAVFTDLLDGFIARKFNMVTNIGKLIDPLADKLLQMAAMFCFYWIGYLPIVAFVLVVFAEIVMVYGASFLLFKKHIVVSANLFGKIASGTFYGAILTTFLHQYTNPFDTYAIFFSITLVYISLVQYWYIAVRNKMRENKENTDN